MKVLLTFDVEVWCGGWDSLDERFPSSFDRYVFGRSSAGDFALPRTLEILGRHGLRGVFFVESLFAARFGIVPLRTIVDMIGSAGHELQLHIHPEWADEASPTVVPGVGVKRPYMHQYSAADQRTLIDTGIALLSEAGAPRPTAFRAGSFAAGPGTFGALSSCGIGLDFSIDSTMPNSVPDWRKEGRDLTTPQSIDSVNTYPMAVFQDGFGRQRHAQVGACSSRELTEGMQGALALGWQNFVILSHNFEMLKPGTIEPDFTVVRRFESLCAHLERAAGTLPVEVTSALSGPCRASDSARQLPAVSRGATARRFLEQLGRRIA